MSSVFWCGFSVFLADSTFPWLPPTIVPYGSFTNTSENLQQSPASSRCSSNVFFRLGHPVPRPTEQAEINEALTKGWASRWFQVLLHLNRDFLPLKHVLLPSGCRGLQSTPQEPQMVCHFAHPITVIKKYMRTLTTQRGPSKERRNPNITRFHSTFLQECAV